MMKTKTKLKLKNIFQKLQLKLKVKNKSKRKSHCFQSISKHNAIFQNSKPEVKSHNTYINNTLLKRLKKFRRGQTN